MLDHSHELSWAFYIQFIFYSVRNK